MTSIENLPAAVDDVLDGIDDDAPASDARPAPYVTALQVRSLFADGAYQRDLDDLRVQAMADQFDPTLLGVLEVSDRGDGTFAILDGQHRWAATRDAHPDGQAAHLVCQVHRGLTVSDEACVFYNIDMRRKALSGWDRWRARRGAGDETVLAVEATVTGVGLTVAPAGDATVSATRALETVWDAGGAELLHNSLFVLAQAYGASRDGYDGQMIQAAAVVLEVYGRDELDVPRLITQLQTIAPRQVKARAQALKEVHRAELPRLCAAVMVERYNAGPGRNLEPLLQRAPASTKLLSKAGRRNRQLEAIRQWARRNGHPVIDKARVARPVMDAYLAAHPGFELAAK